MVTQEAHVRNARRRGCATLSPHAIAATTIAAAVTAAALLVALTPPSGAAGPRAVGVASGVQRPDVVLLVLDEFPGDSLLGKGGRIDPVRYPNFAALAVRRDLVQERLLGLRLHDEGRAADPGRDAAGPGSAADQRYHPESIFTALARHGYRTVSREEATAICPPRLCRGARTRRPAILPRLEPRPRGALRPLPARCCARAAGPTLWMKHALLPHGPYLYLPSGARTRAAARDLVGGMNGVPGFHDTFLTRHNEQRYLLQLQFVDRLIGRLVRRLKAKGMYDRTRSWS